MSKTEFQKMTPAQKDAFIHRMAKSFRHLKPSVQKDAIEYLQKNTKLAKDVAAYITL